MWNPSESSVPTNPDYSPSEVLDPWQASAEMVMLSWALGVGSLGVLSGHYSQLFTLAGLGRDGNALGVGSLGALSGHYSRLFTGSEVRCPEPLPPPDLLLPSLLPVSNLYVEHSQKKLKTLQNSKIANT